MAYVSAQPQAMATAATNVAGIGSTIREANAAAAGSTTAVVVAAQDEVSAAISALFGNYGQQYQALGARVSAFHDQFVQALTSGGNAYNTTEAANTAAVAVVYEERFGAYVGATEQTLLRDVGAVERRVELPLRRVEQQLTRQLLR